METRSKEMRAVAVAELEEMTGDPPAEYLPTLPEPHPRGAASVAHHFVARLDEHWRLAKMLVASGLLPRAVTKPEQAMAIMLKGHELSLPPMQAFASLHIIEGVPTLAASLMMALCVRDAECKFRVLRKDAEGAEVEIQRPGWEPYIGSFTKQDAERVKYRTREGLKPLLAKDNWVNFPVAMYFSRAVSDACRTVCPDILAGMYTPEEVLPEMVVADEGVPVVGRVQAIEVATDERVQDLRSRVEGLKYGISGPSPEAAPAPPGDVPMGEGTGPSGVVAPEQPEGPSAGDSEGGAASPLPGPAVLEVALPSGYYVANTSPGWYLPCLGSSPITSRKWRTAEEAAEACWRHHEQAHERERSAGQRDLL